MTRLHSALLACLLVTASGCDPAPPTAASAPPQVVAPAGADSPGPSPVREDAFRAPVGDPDVVRSQLERRHEDPERVMVLLQVRPGSTVADVGCGAGFYTTRLAHAVGAEGRVYGVDISDSCIVALGQRLHEDPSLDPHGVIELRVSQVRDPGLPPGGVDLVLLSHLDFHLYYPVPPDYLEFIDHCAQALRPGGRLVVLQSVEAAEHWNRERPGASVENIARSYVDAGLQLSSREHIDGGALLPEDRHPDDMAPEGSEILVFARADGGAVR